MLFGVQVNPKPFQPEAGRAELASNAARLPRRLGWIFLGRLEFRVFRIEGLEFGM